MKSLLRSAIATTLSCTGITALMHRRSRRSLVILCYHRVLPSGLRDDSPFPVLAVTPEAFAEHLRFVRGRYECLPLAEAMNRLDSQDVPARPLLSVTFDDGNLDNHEYARPLLREHDVRATFFVISSLVGKDRAPWYDRLARALAYLKELPPDADEPDNPLNLLMARARRNGRVLSISNLVETAKLLDPDTRATTVEAVTAAATRRGWTEPRMDRIMSVDQLHDLASDGHEIGAHTRTHPILPQLSPGECADELQGCRDDLEAMMNRLVVSLAYPNGDYNDAVAAAARRAGYRYAVTTRPGRNRPGGNPLTLRRFFVGQQRYSNAAGTFVPRLMAMELCGAVDRLLGRR